MDPAGWWRLSEVSRVCGMQSGRNEGGGCGEEVWRVWRVWRGKKGGDGDARIGDRGEREGGRDV